MGEQTESSEVSNSNIPGLTVRIAQRTDVGLVRSENQDYAIIGTPEDDGSPLEKGRLMVVADGMGGHRGGATASRLAATALKAEYFMNTAPDVPTALRQALERANAKVFGEAQANAELRGMGTTCSALVVLGDQAHLAHVGDSRIYRVRAGKIEQLTDDHSLVASMVREGLLTAKEAETHPRRNVLQRSMGVGEEVEIDQYEPIKIELGDTFILCSDGLHGQVREEELEEIAKLSIEDAATEYIRKALERGAPDNVTVIVARVEESSGETPKPASDRAITDKIPLVTASMQTAERPAVTPHSAFQVTQKIEPLVLPTTEPGLDETPPAPIRALQVTQELEPIVLPTRSPGLDDTPVRPLQVTQEIEPIVLSPTMPDLDDTAPGVQFDPNATVKAPQPVEAPVAAPSPATNAGGAGSGGAYAHSASEGKGVPLAATDSPSAVKVKAAPVEERGSAIRYLLIVTIFLVLAVAIYVGVVAR